MTKFLQGKYVIGLAILVDEEMVEFECIEEVLELGEGQPSLSLLILDEPERKAGQFVA